MCLRHPRIVVQDIPRPMAGISTPLLSLIFGAADMVVGVRAVYYAGTCMGKYVVGLYSAQLRKFRPSVIRYHATGPLISRASTRSGTALGPMPVATATLGPVSKPDSLEEAGKRDESVGCTNISASNRFLVSLRFCNSGTRTSPEPQCQYCSLAEISHQ